MAYEYRPPGQEDEEQNIAAPPAGTSPPIINPANLGGSPNEIDTPAAPMAAATPQSKFVNFDRVLAANKDVAQRNADQTIGNVAQGVQKSQDALAGLQGKFKTAVEAGKPTWAGSNVAGAAPPTIQRVSGAPQTGYGYTSQQQGLQGEVQRPDPASGPTTISLEEAKKRAAAIYTGPKDLSAVEGWADFSKDATKTRSDLLATGRPGGVQALMQQQYGGTPGGSRLDAALFGATEGGRLGQLRDKFKGFDKVMTDALGESKKQGKDAETAVGAEAQKYRTATTEHEGILDREAHQTEEEQAMQGEENAFYDDPGHNDTFKAWLAAENPMFKYGIGLDDKQREEAQMAWRQEQFDATYGKGAWLRMMAEHRRRGEK